MLSDNSLSRRLRDDKFHESPLPLAAQTESLQASAQHYERTRLDDLAFDAAMQQDAECEWKGVDASLELRTGLERARQLVHIQTLGPFKISIGGVPLTFARKVQKKPLELLKALIALGGKDISETVLAEFLWPDADGDAAAHALATALYRLRKLLGAQVVTRQGGALTLDSYHSCVDLWLLDRLFSRLAEACHGCDVELIARRVEQLTSINRGRFLESDADAPWIFRVRERVRSRMLRQFELAARILARANCVDRAIECYEQALEIDPLLESLYRGLMQCYLSHERRAEALVVYRRCREMLKSAYAIAPSPQTEALMRQLTS